MRANANHSERRRRGFCTSVRAPCPGLLLAHSMTSPRFHSGVRPIFSTGAGACPRATYERHVEAEISVPDSALIRSMHSCEVSLFGLAISDLRVGSGLDRGVADVRPSER